MVMSNLVGGLGNYMFQIAAAYSLSIDNGETCVFGNSVTVHKHVNTYKTNILRNLTHSVLIPSSNYTEPFFHYSKIPYSHNLKLHGYFQSEKYFQHNREKVLEYFSIDGETSSFINTLDILGGETCSIHIRRGDYLGLPNHHPTCTMEYYNEAITKMGDVKFLVFSDDIPWCKENFIGDNYTFVEGNSDYVDIGIMSLCDNNIIANSSFSWWGAWLNRNPSKKVIAPKRWFGSSVNHNTQDLIPKTWTTI